MQLPEQASTFAPEVDVLYDEISLVGVAALAVIVACVAALAWHGRPRSAILEGSSVLQRAPGLLLVVASAAVLAHLFHAGFDGFLRMSAPPPNAITIRVEAYSWGWRFQQPNGLVESELWVPRGEPVRLLMASLPRGTDAGEGAVIHALYIPAFRVQRDIVPGRYTSLWFEASREGTYDIFCTAYCGARSPARGEVLTGDDVRFRGRPTPAAGHAGMLSRVRVVHAEEYEAHLRRSSCPGPTHDTFAAWGRDLFHQNACAACHVVEPGAPATVGPNLADVAGTDRTLLGGARALADADYLRESIRDPQAAVIDGYAHAAMPSFASLGELRLDALVAYLGSLSEHGARVEQAIEDAHPREE